MMKKLLIAGAFAIAALADVLVPELRPFQLAWTHDQQNQVTTYRLRAGTNIFEIPTNAYTLLDITNGVTEWTAVIPGLARGSDVLTLTAVNQLGEESDQSQPLAVIVLGKPLAPQNLRKP